MSYIVNTANSGTMGFFLLNPSLPVPPFEEVFESLNFSPGMTGGFWMSRERCVFFWKKITNKWVRTNGDGLSAVRSQALSLFLLQME